MSGYPEVRVDACQQGELPAVETRFAFVHEGLSGLVMILGEPGVHMVGRFQVHAVTQLDPAGSW